MTNAMTPPNDNTPPKPHWQQTSAIGALKKIGTFNKDDVQYATTYVSGNVPAIIGFVAELLAEREAKDGPRLEEVFADNGEHSHWRLVDPSTGAVLWDQEAKDAQLAQAMEENTHTGVFEKLYEKASYTIIELKDQLAQAQQTIAHRDHAIEVLRHTIEEDVKHHAELRKTNVEQAELIERQQTALRQNAATIDSLNDDVRRKEEEVRSARGQGELWFQAGQNNHLCAEQLRQELAAAQFDKSELDIYKRLYSRWRESSLNRRRRQKQLEDDHDAAQKRVAELEAQVTVKDEKLAHYNMVSLKVRQQLGTYIDNFTANSAMTIPEQIALVQEFIDEANNPSFCACFDEEDREQLRRYAEKLIVVRSTLESLLPPAP